MSFNMNYFIISSSFAGHPFHDVHCGCYLCHGSVHHLFLMCVPCLTCCVRHSRGEGRAGRGQEGAGEGKVERRGGGGVGGAGGEAGGEGGGGKNERFS